MPTAAGSNAKEFTAVASRRTAPSMPSPAFPSAIARVSPYHVMAVVLDMDGLMLDTESLNRLAWQEAAQELGYDLTDAFYGDLIGRAAPMVEAMVQATFGPAFPMETFRTRRRALWHARVADGGIPHRPGLTAFLDAVDARKLPMAVATSTATDVAMRNLASAGLEGRFQALVGGDQIDRGKPEPDIYLEAARRLAVAPDACVALEDSNPGVLAATRAGMITLMVPDLVEPSAEARAAAHLVLSSLADARDWLVDQPRGAS